MMKEGNHRRNRSKPLGKQIFAYKNGLSYAHPVRARDGSPVRNGPDVMPSPAETSIAYGRNRANVSNTPFRNYKASNLEGGIATP